jgi:hypothetical protein
MPVLPALILLALFGWGCSARTPEPIAYPYSQQQKMEASHHWQVLAADLADRINNELISSDNINQAVSVKETCSTDSHACTANETSAFNEAFHDLLVTNLVAFGIPTKPKPDENSLEINYKVQTVRHNSERLRTLQPGVLTGISSAILVLRNAPSELIALSAAAALDVANSNLTTRGNYEVIITTSMQRNNTYLFRASDIYYINDRDFWHYQESFPKAKTLQLTSGNEQGRKERALPLPETVRPLPITDFASGITN